MSLSDLTPSRSTLFITDNEFKFGAFPPPIKRNQDAEACTPQNTVHRLVKQHTRKAKQAGRSTETFTIDSQLLAEGHRRGRVSRLASVVAAMFWRHAFDHQNAIEFVHGGQRDLRPGGVQRASVLEPGQDERAVARDGRTGYRRPLAQVEGTARW